MAEDTREKLKSIKQAIRETYKESFNFELTKSEFLGWLSQIKFPAYPEIASWEECLESFPEPDDEDYKKPAEGLKLRFLLKLYTSNHRYVISIIECFNIDAHGKGILSVHVNTDQTEYNLQKSVELVYKNSFDNSLRPKQTVFVEPFTAESFLESLNNAGIAILGNELKGEMHKDKRPIIKNIVPHNVTFPETT